MNTRCPAWCDRILLSPSARELVLKVRPGLRGETRSER
ncbi:Type I inositol 1,4,5-trisphosphate 5-phosphatase [Liparis tanakae]|uniref:Type I inositol 1,4,5-trisphosphate 5-phosphatase n=1 Tax=Liparis tanakae TaxID=230148 RepID=A0A4Z2E796_9TELE|nr:Type I inositol 1,4,5-trisphosphate 5-phosphatase [Liparis tanakae]